MGGNHESPRADCNGGVSPYPFDTSLNVLKAYSMALGLGMTDEEWKDLKAQVDDSFWVMRVIGPCSLLYSSRHSPSHQATLNYPMTTTASRVVLTSTRGSSSTFPDHSLIL